ncbi:hypothetical protein K3G63_21420 [Hymenobacter sp. HSC-4F20]|uniref:hypothetical protein n=1 Tax=Hymenobacter sp. HSC-4F20 TaxID=2864135 RepID=UPI001C73CE29|nr:hypothetical protein [Hymenobacter sp. HSC-4F20]MBX0293018.1 hypothetical protein [Hymenobacter sp. HSC-4F20]
MKRFWLLLLFCLATWEASAQGTSALGPVLDGSALELARRVFLPVVGLFLLCNFVLAAVKLVLNYLLKKQIVAAATSESIVERLLPRPQDEQNKVVKWVTLLLSTGTGLALCNWYLPWGLHSVIILLFSTAVGFLAYYLFLRRQTK